MKTKEFLFKIKLSVRKRNLFPERRDEDFSSSRTYEIISFCESACFRVRRYHVTYICHGERTTRRDSMWKVRSLREYGDPITRCAPVVFVRYRRMRTDENSIWAVVSLYHISAEMFVFARNKFRRRKRWNTYLPPTRATFLPSTPVVFTHGGGGGGVRRRRAPSALLRISRRVSSFFDSLGRL